ncbi:32966_t:CDS:2, partial [Racocetra persica]
PENDAVDLILEVDESQFFNSENEKKNETNSSQDDLNGEKSQLQLHISLTFDMTDFHSDNSGIHRRSYECSKSCGTTEITCMSLVDKHNHEMDPIIDQTAPHFRRLLEEMLEDIKFYTCHT